MSGDTFTRNRFRWLDQIGADHSRRGLLAFRVAYQIAAHLNRKTGQAFPGQELLAREIGVTTSAVRNAIYQLARDGHLQVTVGKGRGDPNRYRPILKRCNERSTFQAEKGATAEAPSETKTCNEQDTFSNREGATADTERCNEQREKVQRRTKKGATGEAPNPLSNSLNEPIEELFEGGAPSVASPSRPKEKRRESFLPDDWQPSEKDIAFASGEGLSRAEISREAERFRNHWHSAPIAKAKKCNWHLTWRNWILGRDRFNGNALRANGRGENTWKAALNLDHSESDTDDGPVLDLESSEIRHG